MEIGGQIDQLDNLIRDIESSGKMLFVHEITCARSFGPSAAGGAKRTAIRCAKSKSEYYGSRVRA